MNIRSTKSIGMSLVEVVVGAAIIGTSLIAIMGVCGGLVKLSYRNTSRIQAAMLAEEGNEAITTMRDAGWTSLIAPLSNGTTYRLVWNNGSWRATTTPSLIDGFFDRTFTLSAVNRDSSFNVTTSGGTLDTNSRKVLVTVSWRDDGATTTKSLEGYIFNTFNN